MVDQTQVAPAKEAPASGRVELPPRAMARNTAEFFSDVATLAELQGKLAVVELREGTSKLTLAVALLIAGIVIALGCVPIALAALALSIHEFAGLSPAASFGIALLVGVTVAALLAIPASIAIKKDLWMFERSRTEWHRNLQWLRDTMKRLGGSSNAAPATTRP